MKKYHFIRTFGICLNAAYFLLYKKEEDLFKNVLRTNNLSPIEVEVLQGVSRTSLVLMFVRPVSVL